jgi:hypothetical protein
VVVFGVEGAIVLGALVVEVIVGARVVGACVEGAGVVVVRCRGSRRVRSWCGKRWSR